MVPDPCKSKRNEGLFKVPGTPKSGKTGILAFLGEMSVEHGFSASLRKFR